MKAWIDDLAHALLRRVRGPVRRSVAEVDAVNAATAALREQLFAWAEVAPSVAVSLGQNCSTAWTIKAVGAKQASYPFDWLAVSPALLEHVLDDGFRTFLDRRRMIPLLTDGGHRDYHRSLFGHRDPRSFDRHHAYYVRCVDRFNGVLATDEPILFVTTVVNEPAKRRRLAGGFRPAFRLPERQTPAHFQGVMDRLVARHPRSRFLFIEQYTERPFHLELTHRDARMAWVRHDAQGVSTGARYLDPLDDHVMRALLLGALRRR
ncbi:MAG TPA: DUF1796 family putative cysteine peptidase [Flavobacteriales bacterium]|nr:DUF1796 family putative cysteine peptidase [Flavobacteriales bacterium]HMR26007.1 DUF1796 family putative cysteine peptidase [Flavobacteriales bacterium]